MGATLRPPTFRRTAPARYVQVRLQRRLPQLLPLLNSAVVPLQAEVLLRHSAEGVQVEYTCVSTGIQFCLMMPVLAHISAHVSYFSYFPLLIIDGLLTGPAFAPFSSAAIIGGKS